MKKILVFAGSSSSKSINLQLAKFAASLVKNAEIEVLNLNDFEMPIYSTDREEKNGIPELAKKFLSKIEASDTLFISLAEHNGAYTTAFKNIMDWGTRANSKMFFKKPMLLMATSPGARGSRAGTGG
jgi:NAD(P)H-dependent FMN reductase